MSEIRQHNRDRSTKIQAESRFKNYGTQSEQKSTRNVGTMSEPIQTRNSGNDTQPQSSATQTSDLLQQDELDLQQSTSQRSRHDSRTSGYYPSQRSTSLDHRKKYVLPSAISPRQKDYSDYDQHQAPYPSQYNDDPRDQHITTRNDYQRSIIQQPHSSSQTRQRIPSSKSPHRTPPPPVEYRSTAPNDRYRTPSPSDHHRFTQPQQSRSPSPPNQKHIQTSTNQHRTVSPPSQRRSRQPQQSPSPQSPRHHISPKTNLHRTPSPPTKYRSASSDSRHRSPPSSSSKNYPRKTKDQRQMVSTETDTSLDGMKSQQHRGVQPEPPSTREYGIITGADKRYPPQTSHSPNLNTRSSYSPYQTLNSPLSKHQDYVLTPPNQNNYKSVRDDQPPSTQKNYRLRPVRNNSYDNNYEEVPSKHDESFSPEYNRSFDRPKDYISKPFTSDHRQQTRPTMEPRSDQEEQHATLNFTDDVPNEEYIRELPSGGSISIVATTVIQPDSFPRSYGQNKSPIHQKHDHVDHRRKITESSLHHGQQHRIPPIRDSIILNKGTEHIISQSPYNEFATPFNVRYVQKPNHEFTSNNNDNIRSSTLKRDDLRSRSNRILLLPVLNSSRTYVFEKQSLPEHHVRQSRTNGNFYLATSPTLHSLDPSFQADNSEIDPLTQIIDSDNLTGHALRSQVA